MLPGQVGLLQASEAIKLLLGEGSSLVGRFLHLDMSAARVRELKLRRDPECVVCGSSPTVTGFIDYVAFCGGPSSCELRTGEMDEVRPAEAEARRRRKTDPAVLLDVREPDEREVASIAGSLFIPLGELGDRWGELPADREILVHCKSGGRSARAVMLLRGRGLERVVNVAGGIDAWASELSD